MSQKSKRICKCCGKEYEYCPHCGKYSDEPWKNITDTMECREVLNIVSAYNIKLATKEQVKKVIDKYGVTDFNKYKPSIAAVLNGLFKEAPKEEPEVKEGPVVEEAPVVKEEPKVVASSVAEEIPAAPVIEKVSEPVEISEPEQPKAENDLLKVMSEFDNNINKEIEESIVNKVNGISSEPVGTVEESKPEVRRKRRKKYRHVDVDSN